MWNYTMIDYFFILTIIILVLLVVQIIGLIRIRLLIKELRKLINGFNVLFRLTSKKPAISATKKICRDCKFRKTFVDIRESAEPGHFYYRCALDEKPINLSYTCKKFQPDSINLGKSHK